MPPAEQAMSRRHPLEREIIRRFAHARDLDFAAKVRDGEYGAHYERTAVALNAVLTDAEVRPLLDDGAILGVEIRRGRGGFEPLEDGDLSAAEAERLSKLCGRGPTGSCYAEAWQIVAPCARCGAPVNGLCRLPLTLTCERRHDVR